MTETEFEMLAAERGHGDLRVVEFPPHQSPELHGHDWETLVYLTQGSLTMAYEDCVVDLEPGHWCEVLAGELHSERTGDEGATAILATRRPG